MYSNTDSAVRSAPDTAAIRAQVMDGLAEVPAFAEAINRGLRAVRGYMAAGMPTVYIGRTPYIPIADARAWLLKPKTRNAPARPVGRPRKIVAQ